MTSSINLKKIISVGAAALLAIGGVLGAGIPANAAAATSAPVINGTVFAGASTSATAAVWASGTPTAKWYICPNGGSTAAATSIPVGCEALQLSSSNVAAYTATTLTVPTTAYCATSCTSFGTASVGSYLRYIEQNSTDISASAAVLIRGSKSLLLDTPAIGDTSVSVSVSGGCSFASPSMPASNDWTITVAGSTATVSNVATANNKIVFSIGSSLTSGQAISVAYTRSTSSLITCGAIDAVANLGSALTTSVPSGGGGGGGGGTQPCAGQTSITSFAASSSTIAPGGTFTQVYNGNPALSNCLLPTNGFASARFINGTLVGTFYYSAMSTGLNVTPFTYTFSIIQTQAGRNLVDGDTYTSKIWVNPGNVQPSPTSPGDFSYTVTVTGVSGGSVNQLPVLTPEQARNQIKPLPVIVQPLVAAIPVLNKPMVNAGGKLDLSAGDFSGLVSASISGKPLDLTLGAKGGLTITVPNGEAGKTADLFLKFTTGTVIIQDAIKYVAPLVVADVPTRPVTIAAGSTKLSQATADQVRQAAFANMKNTTVSCVAYAANGSAAARAAAQTSAEQVCALAVKSNPALTATPVIVVVDKAKAKTEAVGIKVYKN